MINSHKQCGNSFWTSSCCCKNLFHGCHRCYSTFHVPSHQNIQCIELQSSTEHLVQSTMTMHYKILIIIISVSQPIRLGLCLSESHYISLFLSRGNQKKSSSSHCVSFNCEILGFRREAAKNCALLGYYAASSGNFLLTFRDNLSISSLRFKNTRILNMKSIDCPETSVRNYHYSLRNNPVESGCWFRSF